MKIQVISYNKKIQFGKEHEYTYTSLNDPKTLDMFDLNIVSLQTPELWTNTETNFNSLDSINDFKSLKELLCTVKKAKVVVCFPRNYTYRFSFYGGRYNQQRQLKDMIPSLIDQLNCLLPRRCMYSPVYENSITECGDVRYEASFYFSNSLEKDAITKCVGGGHITTLRENSHLIYTTLNLSNPNINIDAFLASAGLLDKKIEIPSWIHEFKFLDDKAQEEVVSNANEEIQRQQQVIKSAYQKLDENLRYKSILFENGERLVDVVFEILEKMLNCDLSNFVDEKKEDFKIVLQDITFIGEIKGITSNVKSENVSQLDVHCQSYFDALEEQGKYENVKGILIINPLRNKPIDERDKVNDKQIFLAKRNGSLIVTTETLLCLYAKYLGKHISTDEIVKLMRTKTGLLTDTDFA